MLTYACVSYFIGKAGKNLKRLQTLVLDLDFCLLYQTIPLTANPHVPRELNKKYMSHILVLHM